MATTYGVYTDVGSVDTEVITESIPDNLRDDEMGARLASLLIRATSTSALPAGSTWVVQASALQRMN